VKISICQALVSIPVGVNEDFAECQRRSDDLNIALRYRFKKRQKRRQVGGMSFDEVDEWSGIQADDRSI
jgi:hypothetical protein